MLEHADCYANHPETQDAARAATRRRDGFTLLELLATLALVAIVASLAIPAFSALIQNLRMTSLSNTVLGSLQAARSEAIRQNAHVSLCPSADGEQCSTTAGYDDGWLMVSGAEPFANSSPVLRAYAPTSDTIDIRMRFGSGFDGALRYTPRGMIQTTGGGPIFGSVWLCHEGKDRRIAVNFIGRPRLSQEPCRD